MTFGFLGKCTFVFRYELFGCTVLRSFVHTIMKYSTYYTLQRKIHVPSLLVVDTWVCTRISLLKHAGIVNTPITIMGIDMDVATRE